MLAPIGTGPWPRGSGRAAGAGAQRLSRHCLDVGLHGFGNGTRRGRRRSGHGRPRSHRAPGADDRGRSVRVAHPGRRGSAESADRAGGARPGRARPSVSFLAVGNTTVQLTTLPTMRGRVMALQAVAFLGSTPVGGPIAGWVSRYGGGRAGLVLGHSACLLAARLGLVARLV